MKAAAARAADLPPLTPLQRAAIIALAKAFAARQLRALETQQQ